VIYHAPVDFLGDAVIVAAIPGFHMVNGNAKEWLKNNLPVCERKGCIIGKKARGYQDGITLFRNYR
jgi:hypothetical protein